MPIGPTHAPQVGFLLNLYYVLELMAFVVAHTHTTLHLFVKLVLTELFHFPTHIIRLTLVLDVGVGVELICIPGSSSGLRPWDSGVWTPDCYILFH